MLNATYTLTAQTHTKLDLHSKKAQKFKDDVTAALYTAQLGLDKYSSSSCGLLFSQLTWALGMVVNDDHFKTRAMEWVLEPEVFEAFGGFDEPFDLQLRETQSDLTLTMCESMRWVWKTQNELGDEVLSELEQKSRFSQKIAETSLLPEQLKNQVQQCKKTDFFLKEEIMDNILKLGPKTVWIT